jgi:hypothetical protein
VSESVEEEGDESVSAAESTVPNIGTRLVRHWKVWGVAFVLAMTSYVLYGIGGWTIDTTTFGLSALLVVAYGLWSVKYDID